METAFSVRISRAEAFQNELWEMLRRDPKIWDQCKNGTEHTHPEFVELLRNNNDPGAIFIRFAPDGVIVTLESRPRVFYYDAKLGDSIEKKAWDNYWHYENMGASVLIFIRVEEGGPVYCQRLPLIRLVDAMESVRRYPENKRFPVSDGWICPRETGRDSLPSYMSGTPYREIEIGSMIQYECNLFEII